jgi:hypothetical protein
MKRILLLISIILTAKISHAGWVQSDGTIGNTGTPGSFTVKAVQYSTPPGSTAYLYFFLDGLPAGHAFRYSFSTASGSTSLQPAHAFYSMLLTAKTGGSKIEVFLRNNTSGSISSTGTYDFDTIQLDP